MTEHANVHEFWGAASCGEALPMPRHRVVGFRNAATERYWREPSIESSASFGAIGHGELLESGAGQRRDPLLHAARKISPPWVLRRVAKGMGSFMLISSEKADR